MDSEYDYRELRLKSISVYSALIFALVILVILGIHYFWPVKAPDTSGLQVLLDSVASDINAEEGAFGKAHLRIKEATIEVNLAAELSRTEEGGNKEVKVEASGKGSSSHRLVVVLEREPDHEETKTDAAASTKSQSRGKR